MENVIYVRPCVDCQFFDCDYENCVLSHCIKESKILANVVVYDDLPF